MCQDPNTWLAPSTFGRALWIKPCTEDRSNDRLPNHVRSWTTGWFEEKRGRQQSPIHLRKHPVHQSWVLALPVRPLWLGLKMVVALCFSNISIATQPDLVGMPDILRWWNHQGNSLFPSEHVFPAMSKSTSHVRRGWSLRNPFGKLCRNITVVWTDAWSASGWRACHWMPPSWKWAVGWEARHGRRVRNVSSWRSPKMATVVTVLATSSYQQQGGCIQ